MQASIIPAARQRRDIRSEIATLADLSSVHLKQLTSLILNAPNQDTQALLFLPNRQKCHLLLTNRGKKKNPTNLKAEHIFIVLAVQTLQTTTNPSWNLSSHRCCATTGHKSMDPLTRGVWTSEDLKHFTSPRRHPAAPSQLARREARAHLSLGG